MPTVFDKLNLGGASEMLVLNAPESFEPLLAGLSGVHIHRRVARGFRLQFGIAFAITQAQVDTAAKAMASHSEGDVTLWMAYPKQSSKKFTCEFNRDNGWAALGALGFEPVRMVAIDEDWSALNPKRDLPAKQSRGLHHNRAIVERRESWQYRTAAVAVHDKQLAARLVLPAKAHVGAHRARA